MNHRLTTAESVSPKHPDKLCDQVSDAMLDVFLSQDERSRCAIEAMGAHGKLYVAGEVTSNTEVDYKKIAGEVTGMADENIIVNITKQSNEIARGVDVGGAGDQGIMVGYACSENKAMIPQAQYLARKINRTIFEKHPFDGKTQVTIKDGVIDTVVASFQNVSKEELEKIIMNDCEIKEANLFLNPCGDWSTGGFDADTGLTGRKIIVDNYGPNIPVGGGAFSGKDPSKVDRSGAYIARKIAVDILKKRGAKEVYTYIAYAIGVAKPVMAMAVIDGKEESIATHYDLTPWGIIDQLDLLKPRYRKTAEYGHFGNNFIWDQEY